MTSNKVGIYASQISGHLYTPVGSYDSLATITVGSTSVATITFAGIPAGYRHLQIRLIARTDAYSEPGFRITFNGDTNSNYATHRFAGNGSSAYAQSYTSGTSIANYGPGGADLAANIFGTNVIDILDYASTSKNKTVKILSGLDYNGAGTVALYSGLWMNATNGISSITMVTDNNFTQYSHFALYGIK